MDRLTRSSRDVTTLPNVLADWLTTAVEHGGEWGRAWAEQHHSVGSVVDSLVELYDGAARDAAARLARDGVETVLRERLTSLYPSVRWARRAGTCTGWWRVRLSWRPAWACSRAC